MSKIPLTLAGSEKLHQELKSLKKIDRPAIVNAIAEARAHGDLKENAEYHAAREQQSLLEAKIKQLEHTLASANIIDISQFPKSERVIFGSTVTIYNLESSQEVTYTIVGDIEADFENNKISVSSPIARALIGHEVGEEVEINAPNGSFEVEIVKVVY